MTPEAYARAEALLQGNNRRLIVGGEATPTFLPGSDRFRLVERLDEGERVQLVDPDAGTSEEAPADEREPLDRAWSISPDGRWAARVVDYNLFILDRDSGEERQITHDGTRDRAWATELDYRIISAQVRGEPVPPAVAWSPDSRRLLMELTDQSQVADMYMLQLVEDEAPARLVTFRGAHPGDAGVATTVLHVVDVASGAVTPAQMEPVIVSMATLVPIKHAWFSPDGTRVEAVVQRRDQRDLRLLSIDADSGAVRVVAEQHGETMVDPSALVWVHRPAARVLDDGRGLWMSERDGWAHLWLVDGDEWRQVTRGEWVVRELLHVDEERGEAVFTASGREPDGGLVERRLYRVSLEGGEPQLLTPEPLDHRVAVSPSGRWLVDCMSNPMTPTQTVLREARDGTIVKTLTQADVTRLHAAGWRAPERFTVLSADGETELEGLLYLPPDYSEEGSFPLLDIIYPGPQIGLLPTRFGLTFWGFEAYAELGFVGMALNARGTPMRSKAFHDTSYGVLESSPALADHAAAVAQLAERHPGIDATRVAIAGPSGGGYTSFRAMVEHPDTFKVCVSAVGNHDNRRYIAGWGERYIGLVEQNPEAWERQSNIPFASQLRGKLLLIHGEMDANVNPTHTRALIAALVKADVDHDLVMIPDGDHGCFLTEPYAVRRAWDYLVRHLLGEEPPHYKIAPESTRLDVGSLSDEA